VNPRAFNDWRAFTVGLLSRTIKDTIKEERLTERSNEQIKISVQDVMSTVRAWASPLKLRDLEDSLNAIFAEAIELSQFLRRQRALWYVQFPRRPFPPEPLKFDPSSMRDIMCEDEGLDPTYLRQQIVELVVSPALYKRGNVDGERYDIEYPAVAANVLMRKPQHSAT
jgi:hypothetical protein